MIRRPSDKQRIADLEAQVRDLAKDVQERDFELARLQFDLEQAVPAIEDSPAWSATAPTLVGDRPAPGELNEKLNLALVRVLTYGDKLRRCAACGEPATNSAAVEYEWTGDEVRVLLNETCQACDAAFSFGVSSQAWACMEAMRAWEGCRTAAALFKSEVQSARDLEQLDEIPVALRKCRRCDRWLESRDGKAPCLCAEPDVYQG